jgi:hypothetical protein
MEAVIFYPTNDMDRTLIENFARQNSLNFFTIDEDSKRKIAAIELSKLASKNPKAYATDEEILSVVEEVRTERYGKGN